MKELIRDYTLDKFNLFNCKTARRITWAIMAAAAGYFLFHLLLH